jgi:hypothetical protein
MAKTVLSLVLAGFILLSLAACGSSTVENTPTPRVTFTATLPPTASTAVPTSVIVANTPTPPPLTLAQIQSDWLQGIPCAPPCFEGIIPGKTTASEALDILKKNSHIARVTKEDYNDLAGVIKWDWVSQPFVSQIGQGGFVYYKGSSPDNLLVYCISPNFGETGFKFGEVLQAFGEPTHVIANSVLQETGGDSFSVNFIYLNKGLVVGTIINGKISGKPLINQNLVLKNRLDLFVPGFAGLANYTTFSQEEMVPWQDFKDFDFYCREYYGGPCIFHS